MREKQPPLTAAELKNPITSATFFRRAEHFITTNLKGMALPVIKPGSEGWDQWREYFERHLRWTPVVMRKLIDDVPDKPKEGMTVPTLYPQHFDTSFREVEGWEPPAPKRLTPRMYRETIEQLRARYGPNWGLKVMQQENYARRAWKSPDWKDVQPSEELKQLLTPKEPPHA